MLMLSAIQRNPIIKEIYEERTSKGMNKMAAIGLCMHKMLKKSLIISSSFTYV